MSAKVNPSDFALFSLSQLPVALTLSSHTLRLSNSNVGIGDNGGIRKLTNCRGIFIFINDQWLLFIGYNPSKKESEPSIVLNSTRCWQDNEWRGYFMLYLHFHSLKFLIIKFQVWLNCLPAKTSGCISNDTLRNHTQVFIKYKDSISEIPSHPINFNFTPYFLISSIQFLTAETPKLSCLMNVYCCLFVFFSIT